MGEVVHEPLTPVERFSAIFEAHYAAILAYAIRRSSSEADAQEAAAETFSVAWRRFDQLDDTSPLPWLYGVARRVIANRRRSNARRIRLIDRLGSFLSPAQAAPEGESTRLDPVLRALARLSDADQEVLRLVAWEALSNGETALVLGCSPANVSVRLHRARRRLARALPDATHASAGPIRTSAEQKQETVSIEEEQA